MRRRRRGGPVGHIYSFAITWLIISAIVPIYKIWGFLMCVGGAFLAGKLIANAEKKKYGGTEDNVKTEVRKPVTQEVKKPEVKVEKKSYGPEIDPIIEEGNKALAEMGRLYLSIKDVEVRKKINELMRVTDKITQDAIDDPSDIPQIKKFMNYYLPTTIKLLNSYDRMSSQGISGENIDKSMDRINEMLDVAIDAYKKRLDSLYANNALDIETDIDVMNQMLAREGLTGGSDFDTASATQAMK